MPKTTVVNVKCRAELDVYIGRAYRGWAASIWGNPYKLGRDGNREQCIAMYRAYILASPSLMRQLPSLQGKRLGCWCEPQECHGRVLAELADGLADGDTLSDGTRLAEAVYK